MARPRATAGRSDVSTIIAGRNPAGCLADGPLALNTTRTKQLAEASILDDGSVLFRRRLPVGRSWRPRSGPSR